MFCARAGGLPTLPVKGRQMLRPVLLDHPKHFFTSLALLTGALSGQEGGGSKVEF